MQPAGFCEFPHLENLLEYSRTDVPTGLDSNPQATPLCTTEELESLSCPVDSQIGYTISTVYNPAAGGDATILQPLYNSVPPVGKPSDFATFNFLGGLEHPSRGDQLGGVRSDGDYGQYFTSIAGDPLLGEPPVVKAVTVDWGNPSSPANDKYRGETCVDPSIYVALSGGNFPYLGQPGTGCTLNYATWENGPLSPLHWNFFPGEESPENVPFLTGPTLCGPPLVTNEEATYYGNPFTDHASTMEGPGPQGCNELPFNPSFTTSSSTTQSDAPNGLTTELHLPQSNTVEVRATSHLKNASVTLPPGLTMNPSAANGLTACTPAQSGMGTTNEATCPASSELGTAAIETQLLPAHTLVGHIYLGGPEGGGAITAPPYTIYVATGSPRYGVKVTLEGKVSPNPVTGQLTTTFVNQPQSAFTDLILNFKGGENAPLANPLSCGPAELISALTPYDGNPAVTPSSLFNVDFNGAGGVCPNPLPFALSQGSTSTSTAGQPTNYTFSLTRPQGNQYLSKISETLPAGLVGFIPAVTQCGEAQANAGTCPASSEIGTSTVTAGSGSPYSFSGHAYLTGPYAGAPYGLSIVVPSAAGPFNFGNVVTRATININPYTSRVTVTSALPLIVGGVPLRLRSINVAVTRPGFMHNPTNCGVLATETTLTSTFGSLQSVSTPFQTSGCSSLPYKPVFTAETTGPASHQNGVGFAVHVAYPAGIYANNASVFTELPVQLPSRLTTLQQACLQATFEVNPANCPEHSFVGNANVTTPALPGTLAGSAILVSHGGEAFPDLDLVLKGDGVTVILVGHTLIKNGITSTNFSTLPDVPVSDFNLELPSGKFSLLGTNGNLCSQSLLFPTTMTAQNGAVIKQNTLIAVKGCGLEVLSHKVKGKNVSAKVRTPGAGRVSISGNGIKTLYKKVKGITTLTMSAHLSKWGNTLLAREQAHGRKLKLQIRVGYLVINSHGEARYFYSTFTQKVS